MNLKALYVKDFESAKKLAEIFAQDLDKLTDAEFKFFYKGYWFTVSKHTGTFNEFPLFFTITTKVNGEEMTIPMKKFMELKGFDEENEVLKELEGINEVFGL